MMTRAVTATTDITKHTLKNTKTNAIPTIPSISSSNSHEEALNTAVYSVERELLGDEIPHVVQTDDSNIL